MRRHYSRKAIRKTLAGFSLVELLVSIGIFALINTIVLVKHSQFNANILLTNLAYEVALAVREAQVYGLGARETAPGSANFNASYGAHFTSDSSTSFRLYYDLNANGTYDSGELLEEKTVTHGNSIEDFCVRSSGGSYSCAAAGAITSMDILFTRPNPDAIIRSNTGSGFAGARITVISPQGTTKDIVVEGTGQISVE